MEPYEPDFARYYDLLVHGERNVEAPSSDLEFLLGALSSRAPLSRILDVGCGTGRYLLPLTRRGLHLTGLDNSAQMLAQCRQRLDASGLSATLIERDLLQWTPEHAYDAAICMNSMLSYLVNTPDILSALARLRQALRPGGTLVLEIWNIFANTQLFGQAATHELVRNQVHLTWRDAYHFDTRRSVLRTRIDALVVDHGQPATFKREEVLRAMTAGEIEAYLKASGFCDISWLTRSDGQEGSGDDEEFWFFAQRD